MIRRSMTNWRVFRYTVALFLFGVTLQLQAVGTEPPLFNPEWVALEGLFKSEFASNWLKNLHQEIESNLNRCPPTLIPGIDGDRATRAFRLRKNATGGESAILYLQDPVASTFVVITHDAHGCTTVYNGGRSHPFSQRQFFSPFPNVRLPAFEIGADVQILIQDDRVLRPWFRVATETEFLKENTLVWMILAAICAVLTAVIVTMYSFVIHSRTVTAYILYVSAFLWWVVEEFGMVSAWFPEMFSPLNFVEIQCASVALVVLGIGWTMLEFLALRGTARLVIGLGQALSAGAFLGSIWWPFGYRFGSIILAVNATLTMVFLIRHLRGSDLPTKLFTIGFAAAMVGGGMQSLSVA